eukprot:TRINITY_DN6751_c0_g1_i1.p1 TRINITY_DN6751_c0_g1~~TRINITY_DN6751_c0_g1_i1.p1  ORF type:complete len:306 (+),score=49.50 TRINITY_DN6751_c0_g1_i1:430-1347(+)
MKDKLTGKSRGFGFVTFLQPEISLELLSKEHTIDGKEVDCKRAIPKEQIPNLASTSFKTKKLFVGGLPHHISKENFYNYFKTYGNIIDYVLINDKDTGRSRGFGFITFEHEDSLQKVIKDYNSHQILGKWIECKPAVPKQNKYQYSNVEFEGEHEDVFYYDECETPELFMKPNPPQGRRHSTYIERENLSLFTFNVRKTTSIQGYTLYPNLKDDMWDQYINGPEERETMGDVKEVSDELFSAMTRNALWDESPQKKSNYSASTKESNLDQEEFMLRNGDFNRSMWGTPIALTKTRSHSQGIFYSE